MLKWGLKTERRGKDAWLSKIVTDAPAIFSYVLSPDEGEAIPFQSMTDALAFACERNIDGKFSIEALKPAPIE